MLLKGTILLKCKTAFKLPNYPSSLFWISKLYYNSQNSLLIRKTQCRHSALNQLHLSSNVQKALKVLISKEIGNRFGFLRTLLSGIRTLFSSCIVVDLKGRTANFKVQFIRPRECCVVRFSLGLKIRRLAVKVKDPDLFFWTWPILRCNKLPRTLLHSYSPEGLFI